MPGVKATGYKAATTPEARKLDEIADKEQQDRAGQIDRAWRYYLGDHDKPLKVASGRRDDNVIINVCGQAVDKEVSFFAPKEPVITIPGAVQVGIDRKTGQRVQEQSAEQAQLEAFWDENRLRGFVVEGAQSGFLAGHNFAKLLEPREPGDTPRVALLDPRHVTVMWDAADIHRALWYRVQWGEGDDQRRQDIVPVWLVRELGEVEQREYDPESEWMIYEYKRTKAADTNGWELVGEDAWPYPFAPIVDWKADPLPHHYYGPGDLDGVMSLNDAINFVASNTLRIIRYHAHPKTVARGVKFGEGGNASMGPNDIIEIPADADMMTLGMQGDLASSMAMLETLRNAFFAQMRVVDWSTQKDRVGALTNFGLRVLFDDMLDNILVKRQLYGRALAEISRRALWLMGVYLDAAPEVKWDDPLPVDRVAVLQAAQLEAQLGVSPQTILESIGRDYYDEQARTAESGNNAGAAFAEMLAKVGERGGMAA